MTDQASKPIVNLDQLEFSDWGRGEAYAARLGRASQQLGARKLGYNVTELPPGKKAFPAHNHYAIEEMFFVLAGRGEVRIGDQIFPLRAGDFVACPCGGPETAHQIRNTSENEVLRYLAVSTTDSPDLVEYPDSGKFGMYHEHSDLSGDTAKRFWFLNREQADQDDYWEGEEPD